MRNLWKNTVLCILITVLFLMPISALQKEIEEQEVSHCVLLDQLDQSQTEHSGADFLPRGGERAQGFRPTLPKLTRVQLYINKNGTGPTFYDQYLLMIRENKPDGPTVMVSFLDASQLQTGSHWVEFDFTNYSCKLTPSKQYYMVIKGENEISGTSPLYWMYEICDPYLYGDAYWHNATSFNWHRLWVLNCSCDFCFQTYGEVSTEADLDCSGSLVWSNVGPGDHVCANFTLENIGDTDSSLNWKVESYPSWGNWNFTPESGTGLKPSDGPVTVQVCVDAPNVERATFSGHVLVVNIDNEGDYKTLPVSLSTPQNKIITNPFLNYLESLSHNHPCIFPILRQILLFLR